MTNEPRLVDWGCKPQQHGYTRITHTDQHLTVTNTTASKPRLVVWCNIDSYL